MNPIRILARQTARTSLDPHDRRRSEALLAAASAGMPRIWYLTARWRWAQDETVLPELFKAAIAKASVTAARDGWRDSAAVVPDMVELALAEIMWPGSFKTDAQRLEWLGWSKGAWSRRRRQYDVVHQLVDGWTASAYGYLIAMQREPEPPG